jgi:hypothetical protein
MARGFSGVVSVASPCSDTNRVSASSAIVCASRRAARTASSPTRRAIIKHHPRNAAASTPRTEPRWRWMRHSVSCVRSSAAASGSVAAVARRGAVSRRRRCQRARRAANVARPRATPMIREQPRHLQEESSRAPSVRNDDDVTPSGRSPCHPVSRLRPSSRQQSLIRFVCLRFICRRIVASAGYIHPCRARLLPCRAALRNS